MDKFSFYLNLIRKPDDRFGNELIKLMDCYQVTRLSDLSVQKLKDYCTDVLQIDLPAKEAKNERTAYL